MTTPLDQVDWSKVTAAEFNALTIIRCPQAADLIDAYHVQLHADRLAMETSAGLAPDPADQGPSRLTVEDRAWLDGLQSRYQITASDATIMTAAREFTDRFGSLLARNVADTVRALPIPA